MVYKNEENIISFLWELWDIVVRLLEKFYTDSF